MGMYDDINKAARDPHYRMMYEHKRTMEKITKPIVTRADIERREREERATREKKRKQSEDGKVICTELVRQEQLTREDYLAGARYVEDHLTERHLRGYHAWAIPVVRHMRRSCRATAFWRVLAQARADHIAFLNGDPSRRNHFGALLCAVGHPVCWILGGLVTAPDWQSLYRGEETTAAR